MEEASKGRVLPVIAVLLAVLVAAAPWGLPPTTIFVLPLVTVTLIYILAAEYEPVLPAWTAFATGLVMDLLTAGPLGYWALIHLLTYTLARGFSPETRHWRLAALWVCFSITVVIVACAGWAIASIYFVRPLDWRPLATGVAVVLGVFPMLAALMTHFLGLGPGLRRRHG